MSVQSLRAPFCLVASPMMTDPYFSQTVIIVVEYNRHGALGFIINRPKAVPLKNLVSNSSIDVPENIPTWYGGPVGLDSGIVLANQKIAQIPPDIATISGEMVALSSDDQAIQQLVDFTGDLARELRLNPAQLAEVTNFYAYRFVVGYAGWGPLQLDAEIKQSTWLEVPISDRLIFSTPWEKMWNFAIDQIGFQQQFFSQPNQSLPM